MEILALSIAIIGAGLGISVTLASAVQVLREIRDELRKIAKGKLT